MIHAHVTRHGIATYSGRTIRHDAIPADVAIDQASGIVAGARADGVYPSMLAYAPDGVSCPACTDGVRGERTYGTALCDRTGAVLGAVHVNLCAIAHV
jgi:hypothetical protein